MAGRRRVAAAVFLLLPVPVVALFLMLGLFFSSPVIEARHIVSDLYYNLDGVGVISGGSAEMTVYSQPGFLPFLAHRRRTVMLDGNQCAVNKIVVEPQPDVKHLTVRCPYYEVMHKDGSQDVIIAISW